jgi:pyruvate dehydrogenase E2 component (dihydrolipoamide acetyltransferase)
MAWNLYQKVVLTKFSYKNRFKNADISVAVDTGKGLITPIVFHAEKKGFQEISTTVKDLAERAKKNALKPEEFIVRF